MRDNPNHLLWRERTYEVRMAGCRRGNARFGALRKPSSVLSLSPKTDIHNSDVYLGRQRTQEWC